MLVDQQVMKGAALLVEVTDLDPYQDLGLFLYKGDKTVSRIQGIHLSIFLCVHAWESVDSGLGNNQWSNQGKSNKGSDPLGSRFESPTRHITKMR